MLNTINNIAVQDLPHSIGLISAYYYGECPSGGTAYTPCIAFSNVEVRKSRCKSYTQVRVIKMLMTQIFLAIAAILGGISVAAGAFATHALRERLSERALEIFEKGAQYQMYHVLALLLVASLLSRTEPPQPSLVVAGVAFITGIVIFSGSLYALSLTDIKWLGAITPLGGAAFLIGWGCLAVAAFSYK